MTTQNNPMSGQISICLDKVTSQHVNVIFSSASGICIHVLISSGICTCTNIKWYMYKH